MQAQSTPERLLTVEEWEKLIDYPRTELIDGHLRMMAPPSWEHQRISFELGRQFGNYLQGKSCVAAQEVGVKFEENEPHPTVFVPDLVVVCDPCKIKSKGIVGAPDLVIEILSPSTGSIDKVLKLDRYKQEGVREYWIVDPTHKVVDVLLWDKSPVTKTYNSEDKISVGVLDDCEIDLSLVFPKQGFSDEF